MGQFTNFGNSADGALTISTDTTDDPIDSSCSGSSGGTSLSATNASFTAGQMLLIHQTRGTGVGQWEINQIASYVAGTITTVLPMAYTYTDSGDSQAQVLVLKRYSSVKVNTGVSYTAKTWNSNVGGILAFLCSGVTNIIGTLSALGKGYNGGSWEVSQANQGEGTIALGTTSTAANGTGGGGGGGDYASAAGGGG